jgi:N-acetylneuraminic acid mutarotase
MKTKVNLQIIRRRIFFILIVLSITVLNSNAQWMLKAPLLGSANRNGASSWVIGSKAYIVGGGGSGNLQEYDPGANTWTIKAAVPWPGILAFSVSFVINGKGYICTGQDANNNVYDNLWEYNPVTNTWAAKAQLPGFARTCAFGFSIGNKGYVCCGLDAGLNLFNDVWEYDATTDLWTPKNDFGNDSHRFRYMGVGTSINGFGYAGLGFGIDDFQPVFIEYKDFWKYDPALDLWTQVTDFPGTERRLATIASSSSKIYLGLGNTNNLSSTAHDFYSYNPVTDLWSPITNFTSGRANAAGFFLNNALYFSTGTDLTNFYKDLWKLDFSTGVSEITQNPGISIFPNPASDFINVHSPQNNVSRIEVLNALGEIVLSDKINNENKNIPLRDIPAGTYFLKAILSDGRSIEDKLLLIK